MKFVKQNISLSIVNLDKFVVNKNMKLVRRHSDLLPNTIRCIICGPSNCGKTNLILNLLFSSNGLCFNNIYIYSKSLHQCKYKLLECVLENLPEIGYFPYSDNELIPPPNQVRPRSIMIFDDVSYGKQKNIKDYFSMGRHNDVDTFYICQTYSYVPKQLVRDNANLLVVFKQDDRNLLHIYNDHVNTDMSFSIFKDMCLKIWKSGRNKFLVIDKDSALNRGRYRSGFDIFIQL